MSDKLVQSRARGIWLVPLCAMSVMLSACGGGGSAASGASGTTSSVSTTNAEAACSGSCGTVMATMTDAPGDFTSYVVTVDSLQLQKADGTSVETVPVPTTVDFSQLVDLTELIDAGQIPAGAYVSATLSLDYSAAQIVVDAQSGSGTDTIAPANIYEAGANGGTATQLTSPLQVTVTFDSQHPLVITASNTARIAFDFNLANSNVVNFSANPVTLTVSPTLVATVAPSDTKPIRVRGALVGAGSSANSFEVNVQPFWSQTSVGQETVAVTANTTYQVNGAAYVGSAGLQAVLALPVNTMVASFGSLNTSSSPAAFTATNVVAGTSLQSPSQDHLSGTVVAVTLPGSGSNSGSSTVLTVTNSTWSKPGGFWGAFIPNSVPVSVGSGTVVLEEGGTGSYNTADISVGQHIDVFGTGTEGSNHELSSLDATAGQVQLDLTPAWGIVTSLTAPGSGSAGSVVLNLQSLDGQSIGSNVFNFAGTGATSASNASPAAYVVDSGTLSQSGLTVGSPAQVFGFVAPFGSVASTSSSPDFTATTLVNYAAVTNYLNVGWGWSGTTTAFSGLTASSTSLTLDLANVGWLHFVKIGPQILDLTTLSTATVIAPATTGSVVFTIGHAGKFKVENFNTFAAFVTQLSSEYAGSVALIGLNATGGYNASSNTFTATSIAVLLSQ